MSTPSTNELRGERLAKTVINRILADPTTWDQRNWHSACGTKHCFAGHCQIAGGKRANGATASRDAMELLGLTPSEAAFYFRATATLGELYNLAANFGVQYRDGFNRAGFDRAGFDRDGRDRAGFDRDGFDRAGRDRAGFDCDGFDCDGFNRAGFDRAGRDRAGFDRDGKKLTPFTDV